VTTQLDITSRKDALLSLYREYGRDPAFDHLRAYGSNLVGGCGPLTAKIMLIGEAPGKTEDNELTPFVGKAGKILEEVLLPAAGLKREQVFITNTVKYRPPDNRTPTPAEVEASKSYVGRELLIINPDITVLMGRPTLEMVFPGYGIGAFHGDVLTKKGRDYLVSYHPAVWFYDPDKRPVMLGDFEKLEDYK
jgi:DNA polymerase